MTIVKPRSDHPTDRQLDELRAGIPDERSAECVALRAHVTECAVCAARIGLWNQTKDILSIERTGVRHALRARRAAALAGKAATIIHPIRWGLPMALAAGVAAAALGLGVLLYTPDNTDDGQLATAAAEEPDLYTDIDFYLWLLRQQQDESGPSG